MTDPRLSAELAADPAGYGYATMTDAEIAAAWQVADRPVFVDVPVAALAGLCDLHGITPKLIAATSHDEAQTLLRYVQGDTAVTTIAYADPVKRPLLDGLIDAIVAGTDVTAADAALIRGLGTKQVTRPAELGLGRVTERMIREHR